MSHCFSTSVCSVCCCVPKHVVSGIADDHGFGVIANYCGHGIGREFHMPPIVMHNRNTSPYTMFSGMTFTIEPMLTEGKADNYTLEDKWTIVTVDGKRCAQFEETIMITFDGKAEIMTDPNKWDGPR